MGVLKMNTCSRKSNKITLNVSDKPKPILGANQTNIPVGGSVILTCSVRESEGWEYYWYRDKKDSELVNIPDGVSHSRAETRGGLYWCRGGRGSPVYYTQYSDPISMNKIVDRRAAVILQHKWSQVFRGETITLRCEIQGGEDTEWDYEWSTTNSYQPPKQAEYRISYVDVINNGEYKCKGRLKGDQYSSTEWSDAFKFTVSNKPKPILGADQTNIPVGGSVILTCSVRESEGWEYYWYRDKKDSELVNIPDGVSHSRAETRGGLYWCRGGRGSPVYYTQYSDPIRVTTTVSRPAKQQAMSSSFLVGLCVGLVVVFLVIILLILLLHCRKSKDPHGDRSIQLQDTNQGSATDQSVNQREAPDNDEYIPLQHDGADVNET
ncbi:Fc receptor-like protein 4 [Polymixia lowei]